jgi:hypothetical protein
MTVIQALQTFLKTFSAFTNKNVFVNKLDNQPIEYSIVPLPGAQIVEESITGKRTLAYPFALQTTRYTADDVDRVANSGFFEEFAAWLRGKTNADQMPNLGTGLKAESIEATDRGSLFEQGESETGIYQITCMLIYYET